MNMLNNKVSAKKMKGSMAGFLISMVIAIVILFALLPTVNAAIASAGLTGTNASLAQLVITLLILVPAAGIGMTLA